jgi:hypothetical protein
LIFQYLYAWFVDFGLYLLEKASSLAAGGNTYKDRFRVDDRFIRLNFIGLLFYVLKLTKRWYMFFIEFKLNSRIFTLIINLHPLDMWKSIAILGNICISKINLYWVPNHDNLCNFFFVKKSIRTFNWFLFFYEIRLTDFENNLYIVYIETNK